MNCNDHFPPIGRSTHWIFDTWDESAVCLCFLNISVLPHPFQSPRPKDFEKVCWGSCVLFLKLVLKADGEDGMGFWGRKQCGGQHCAPWLRKWQGLSLNYGNCQAEESAHGDLDRKARSSNCQFGGQGILLSQLGRPKLFVKTMKNDKDLKYAEFVGSCNSSKKHHWICWWLAE